MLLEKGINYFGVGVSSGEEGARFGPALMPGGDEKAYEEIRPILEAIAAKVNGIPCCSYTSTGGAGHYVKWFIMVLSMEIYNLSQKLTKS